MLSERQLQTLLPELHCAVGSYAVFEEFAARDQAESACVSTVALLCNRYDIYTEQQPDGDKLSLPFARKPEKLKSRRWM